MKIDKENIRECIFAFIQTMNAYKFIVQELPLSEELKLFAEGQFKTLDLSRLAKSDPAFVDIRLMLQRKYFSRGGNVYLPNLLKEGTSVSDLNHEAIKSIDENLESLNNRPIELVSPNGSVIKSNYKIAEAIIYGHYLHADTEKLESLLHLPLRTVTLLIAPFVIGRENILLRATDLFSNYCPKVVMMKDEASGFLRLDPESTEKREVNASPFWRNAYGHDAAYEEICSIAQANTLDDNMVIMLAATFFKELARPDFDKDALREFVWKDYWKDWGDFSEANRIASTFEHPGFSSEVLHNGGENHAQVKILPHVIEPWITNTAQYPLSETCSVLLTKRNGEWKINGLMRSALDEA